MSEKYRRIVVSKRGGPEVLQPQLAPTPDPGPDEVRIRVEAAGVSALDVMVRSLSFPGFNKTPFTPGCDVVGLTDAIGDRVESLERGQRVASGPFMDGGYAEQIIRPADSVVAVPDEVDPVEAVSLVANYTTAHLMLHEVAGMKSKERILVHGAAGGVGTALLELGSLTGLEMYGTASVHNHDLVRRLGATPIDYRTENFVDKIQELTGDGVDAVFDHIGGARQLWRSYRTLRRGGRLVWFGVAATKQRGVRVIPESLLTRMLLALIPDGKKAPLSPNADNLDQRETLAYLLELLAVGKIKPVVAARVPLAEASRAHELIEAGRHTGKVVLTVGDWSV